MSQTDGTNTLNFAYTADGVPRSVNYNGTDYYYLYNLQGDVVAIYDRGGNPMVHYTYDSWGKLVSVTGLMASTLGAKNPFRYRGYYYDTETGFYYLTTRYYDPEVCRFINVDGYISTGQGFAGFNMFAYCLNNPVNHKDSSGTISSAVNTVKNIVYLIVALSVIDQYATNNNLNILNVHEYVDRMTNESTTLDELTAIMVLGAIVVSGGGLKNAYDDAAENTSLLTEILGYIAKDLDFDNYNFVLSQIGDNLELFSLIFNPLLSTDEFNKEIILYSVDISVSALLGVFTAACTSAGSVVMPGIGTAIGVGGGLILQFLWDGIMDSF